MLFLLITLKKYRYDGVANLQCVQAIEFRSKHIVGRLILDTFLAENPPEGRKFFWGDFQLPVYSFGLVYSIPYVRTPPQPPRDTVTCESVADGLTHNAS